MNTKRFLSVAKASLLSAGVIMAMSLSLQSCKEDIDDSAFAIKTELTIADYLHENSEFSGITEIFSTVPLSPFKDDDAGDASPIISVLSARGNYTAFVPTNAALNNFAKANGHENYTQLTTEEKKLIAYSCIIDNGNNEAYESAVFPTPGNAFILPDLSDRLITCDMDDEGNIILNGTSKLTKTDIELSNGYLHIIGDDSSPIAPSNESVADLIKEADNAQGMAFLLEKTGWDIMMNTDNAHIDTEYETVHRDEYLSIPNLARFNVAQHRYLGYTAFVETDDVFESELGVSVQDKEAFLAAITAKAESVYGTAQQGDYKHPDNAVNRFVAYHLIDAKMPFNMLVRHYNEYGYKYGDMKNPQTQELSVDVWDYYATAGDHRALLKVSQDGQAPERATSKNVYLNRISSYETLNYSTVGVRKEGIQVMADNRLEDGTLYNNNAKNGFYFPIKGILLDDEANQSALASERIRFDITTILPELMSNNVRGGVYTHFPNGYFGNLTNESADTKLLYLNSAAVSGTAWRDYQGDEFMACGQFDFVLKLPPVPQSGTYELRFGVSHNTLRGMAQLYVGDSPYNLQPAGQPYDMRQSVTNNENIGFEKDTNDDNVNAEIDKSMRNHGFMKAPRYSQLPDGTGTSLQLRKVEDATGCLRRIIKVDYFDKDKTYYIRFKSALAQTDAQFFLDYFEFCPTIVYNGTTPEDQW